MSLEIFSAKLGSLIELLATLSKENTDRRIGEMLQSALAQVTAIIPMALEAATERGKLAIRVEAFEHENIRLKQKLKEAEELVNMLRPENIEMKKQLKRQNLNFVPFGGYYLESETGLRICTHCLAKGQTVHMLAQDAGFMCMACGTTYPGGL